MRRVVEVVLLAMILLLAACSPDAGVQQKLAPSPTPKTPQGDYSQKHTGWAP